MRLVPCFFVLLLLDCRPTRAGDPPRAPGPAVPRLAQADPYARRVRPAPGAPVYASPQSPPTGGVISPDRPVTVTVPWPTTPAPTYAPPYGFPAYPTPSLPFFGRRRLFGRGGGGCMINADGSMSCGR